MPVAETMSPSTEIRDTVLEMYRRMLAGESEAANDLISRDPAMIFIGSAGEWVDDQAALRSGTQEPGEGLEAGPNPVGYANGDVGWFADQPSWLFADGTRAEMRLSAVLQREDPGLADRPRPHVRRRAGQRMRHAPAPLEARHPRAELTARPPCCRDGRRGQAAHRRRHGTRWRSCFARVATRAGAGASSGGCAPRTLRR